MHQQPPHAPFSPKSVSIAPQSAGVAGLTATGAASSTVAFFIALHHMPAPRSIIYGPVQHE
jgi:hypothetical protein